MSSACFAAGNRIRSGRIQAENASICFENHASRSKFEVIGKCIPLSLTKPELLHWSKGAFNDSWSGNNCSRQNAAPTRMRRSAKPDQLNISDAPNRSLASRVPPVVESQPDAAWGTRRSSIKASHKWVNSDIEVPLVESMRRRPARRRMPLRKQLQARNRQLEEPRCSCLFNNFGCAQPGPADRMRPDSVVLPQRRNRDDA